jgi:Zn finger protein HypA/HybF involved in hydrogenase expression
LCACEEYVLTIYKNPHAFKRDRCKAKYNAHLGESCCPNCKAKIYETALTATPYRAADDAA